ncbi:BREX system P-loop protein BrxC [Ectobacillus sp. JY-23]|uniref:BREX system P-loop protein BrxC n=1 Tax=Ectobacillus sp. JY-23 TaxID=2933872 RepID=UPI001FF64749|nr:BREX system P-loop protein BrxC [Ectobacillus sp. JY-23]UOY92503.1 BREX system P-loop protein BrxC [Ectobacillus sp. JY-23]
MLQDAFTIEELFKKKIDREINGVVQAGQRDEKVILDELEEYVMTKEISENMAYFFKNYAYSFDNQTTKMGVWISGFFGSGKSHFLKILSYLLNNETVFGKRAVDFFKDKTDDQELLTIMQRSASYNSQAILFNVDSKSAGGKKEKATIVEVFLKVFNEYLGYSSTPWIANLERQLTEEGVYTQFVERFEEIDNTKWVDSRARVLFKKKSFIEALVQLGYTKDTAEAVLAASNKNYEMSSDDFAKLVAQYVAAQGDNYRLTFLVDEIGQYIGDDTDLMLNLQTITEDLGNHCQGKVWVIVTSQEQIDAVTKVKGTENFSKIQGRFATKIHLTSSNTDEVIKRRLLEKTAATTDRLQIDFDQIGQSLNNTLTFEKDKSVLQNGFKDANEYAAIYPFVPYQVELLQRVFNKVRRQGEAGAHLSQGERSLLNAFQEVAIQLKDEDTNQLARFSQFYETVKRFLSTSVSSTISEAAKREGITGFDVEVLKVLFMIKSIDEIKATLENITTLLVDSVDCIKNDLEKRVVQSLIRLRQKMLIAENADRTFVFLSDDEQEINREIQSENVNDANVTDALGRFFYEDIIQMRSYRYQKTHDFEFNKAFDTYNRGGKTNALTLQVYTGDVSEEQARADANSGTMIMYIPEQYAGKFFEPMQYAQKIQSFANKKISTSLTDKQKRIVDEKRQQISEFEKKAKEALEEAAANAKYFIQGQDYEFKGALENQLQGAFEVLVRNTYSYLSYIDEPVLVKNAENTIKEWATNGLSGRLDGTFANHLAYETIVRFLEESRGRQVVTLKTLVEKFKDVPYGWSENDIAGMVAAAVYYKKIKLSYLSEAFDVEHPQFIGRITKTSEREKVVLEAQIGIPARVRKDVVEAMRELFNFYDIGETYDEVAKSIREQIQKHFIEPIEDMQRVKQRENTQYPYPGGIKLSKIKNSILELMGISKQENFVEEFIELDKDLEEWLEDVQHLNSFYNGHALRHFDESVKVLAERRDDLDVAKHDADVQKVKQSIIAILTNDNPFKQIPNLPLLNEQLKTGLSNFVKREIGVQLEQMEEIQRDMQALQERYQNIDTIKTVVAQKLEELQKRIAQMQDLESISRVYTYTQMANNDYRRLEDQVRELYDAYVTDNGGDDEQVVEMNLSQLLNVALPTGQFEIKTEQDLTQWMEKLANQVRQELNRGNSVIIKK